MEHEYFQFYYSFYCFKPKQKSKRILIFNCLTAMAIQSRIFMILLVRILKNIFFNEIKKKLVSNSLNFSI